LLRLSNAALDGPTKSQPAAYSVNTQASAEQAIIKAFDHVVLNNIRPKIIDCILEININIIEICKGISKIILL
jgi:hypothetical protein